MQGLRYINQPKIGKYDSLKSRNYLRKVSKYACAYCTITESEAPGATFHIDHFRPQALFSDLTDECTNLRYTCPRCNLLKSKLWITLDQGCIRKCQECHTKGCHENIYRFIDSLHENPKQHLFLNDRDEIEAMEDSKPGTYTIKYLRLNRAQLIKLRKVRRFLELWEQELKQKKRIAEKQLDEILQKKIFFETKNQLLNKVNDETELANILFSMLELQARYLIDIYDHEINNVETLKMSHIGADDKI